MLAMTDDSYQNHGLIAQLVRESEPKSVVLCSNPNQAKCL